jgi:hypothetical protein
MPTSDVLSVQGANLTNTTSIGLYDTNGNLVRSFGNPQSQATTLPLAGLATGQYRLVMSLQNGTMVGSPVTVIR